MADDVDAFVEGLLLDGIADLGHVTQVDVPSAVARHQHVVEFVARVEFAVGLDVDRIVADVDRTGRHIHVFGRNHLAELFDGQVVGLHLARIDIDLHLAHRGAHHADRTDALDAVEAVDQLFVKQFVEAVVTVVGRHGEHHDRDHGAAELVDRRIVHLVGQQRPRTVHGIADVVGRHIQVCSPFELERDHREVVLRPGGDLLQILHRVEVVLQHTGDVSLDIGSVRTRIGRDDRYGRQVHLGIHVDGQIAQREGAENHHHDEDQYRRNRFSDRTFVYFHKLPFSLLKHTCGVRGGHSPSMTETAMPPSSRAEPAMTTSSPSFRPSRISIRSPT